MNTEKFWLWLARKLPRKLRYWATIVSGAEASQYEEEVPAMLFVDVLKRIEK